MAPTPQRTAIVIEAARGIGRAIALRLAADCFDLALNDLPGSHDALEDVAGLVSDLASPDAAYMTGQSVLIDGGMRLTRPGTDANCDRALP